MMFYQWINCKMMVKVYYWFGRISFWDHVFWFI